MNLHDLIANGMEHWQTGLFFILAFGWDDALIAFALLVVSAAITALTTKRPSIQNEKPATLDEFQIPQIKEGTPQAVVFGDVWLTGWQVLWYGNLQVDPIMASTPSKK